MKTFFLVTLFSIVLNISLCFGQYGQLDSTFGNTGKVITSFAINGLAVQSDGKIVVGGVSFNDEYSIARYNSDGTIDSSFGNNGLFKTVMGIGFNNPYAIALQPDGKVLQSGNCVNNLGNWSFALLRCNSDGTLDNSFNTNGKVYTSFNTIGIADYGHGVTVQPDGKIIQVGFAQDNLNTNQFGTVRFNSNGSLDYSFGSGGKVLTEIAPQTNAAICVLVQPDGKIVVGGTAGTSSTQSCFALVRYNTDGTLDNNFGTGGIVTSYFGTGQSGNIDEGWAIALQPDGKILMTGKSYQTPDTFTTIAVARYNADGSLDNTFGTAGKIQTMIPEYNIAISYSMTIQPDSKIVVAGYCAEALGSHNQFALIRYNADGTPDNSFGESGILISDLDTNSTIASSVSIQPDGKIVAAGGNVYNGIIARYISGLNVGTLDSPVSYQELLIYPNPIKSEALLQYTLLNAEKINIELIDMQGRILQSFGTADQRAGEHQEVLQIDEKVTSGCYILRIGYGNHSQVVKVVVQ